jgi:hypothetical protein
MKKLILSALACIALVITSCNQNSPTPAPATPATPTPTPTSSMTATEALLVGDWIWDKTENYNSGNLFRIWTPTTYQQLPSAASTYTAYSGSHMVLKSSFYNGTATPLASMPQSYNADYSIGFASFSQAWQVNQLATGNQLQTTSNGYPSNLGGNIITLNATTLVVQEWLPGQIANGNKCFYHK